MFHRMIYVMFDGMFDVMVDGMFDGQPQKRAEPFGGHRRGLSHLAATEEG